MLLYICSYSLQPVLPHLVGSLVWLLQAESKGRLLNPLLFLSLIHYMIWVFVALAASWSSHLCLAHLPFILCSAATELCLTCHTTLPFKFMLNILAIQLPSDCTSGTRQMVFPLPRMSSFPTPSTLAHAHPQPTPAHLQLLCVLVCCLGSPLL